MDAHSKWIEATCTSSTSSSAVIDSLRPLIARFGLPETVVTDNGPGFVSQEFEQFLKNNGIYHTTSAPYHPASNGLAERAVQTVKKGLKKEKSGNMTSRLSKVLLAYRMTPQSTTGNSPAEMLLGRRPRTRLDLLKPNTAERVERRQQEQKIQHDKRARSRSFSVEDRVFVRNFSAGDRWLPGRIVNLAGPVSFHVQLEDGRRRKCHQDQLRARVVGDGHPDMVTDLAPEATDENFPSIPASSGVPVGAHEMAPTQPQSPPPVGEPPQGPTESPTTDHSSSILSRSVETLTRRYPSRIRQPRQIFEPGTV